MNNDYYTYDEIKAKFKNYRERKESTLTDEEYDLFCDQIQVLPKEIVDKIQVEIQFVLMSANPKNGTPACYMNLKGLDKRKKAIIVLTPLIFKHFTDKNGNEWPPNNIAQTRILHEIAHHVLNHLEIESEQDYKQKEKEAKKQVEDWIVQWTEREMNESQKIKTAI